MNFKLDSTTDFKRKSVALNSKTTNVPKKKANNMKNRGFVNVCDCLDLSCPGCHFPCKTCGSKKCARVCRVDRNWQYDDITLDGRAELDGTAIVVKRNKQEQAKTVA